MSANPPKGAVLVTGTSSGIGEATVRQLSRLGFRVFAGVRKEADAEGWTKAGVAEAVMLDVTDARSIQSARNFVANRTGDAGLAGLVNNAGAVVAGPIEYLPMDQVRRQFETNVLGVMSVTQAFIDLLRKGHGRIVNVGSISGRSAMPFMSAYASSKFAIEAISDSLRVELRPWNIPVSLLEPGSVSTPLFDKYLKDLDGYVDALPQEARDRYGVALKGVRVMARRNGREGHAPERIAAVIGKAMTAKRPKARYICGETPRMMLVLEALPWRIRDWIVDASLQKMGRS